MPQAKHGDTVKIHYTGRLDDGTVFDTSEGRDPLSFTLGKGHVIPGFEDVVLGMSPGESKTERIPSEKAYGGHRGDLLLEVQKENIPDNVTLEVGQQLVIGNEQGDTLRVLVTEVTDDTVSLDANHPLAGKDLTFQIKLLEIS